MRIHVVGVSGTLMASIAGLLVEQGHQVTGSDTAFDPPMGPALTAWGVECRRGFRPEHLDPKPDLVIVGNVCRKDNPEAMAAWASGVRVLHVAQAINEFALAGTLPLVVAGTHGKTTTTALAAFLLEHAGRNPGFLIGGMARNFSRSYRSAPRGRRLPLTGSNPDSSAARPPFVIEGDEYDTAYFEKTPKFIHYRPEIAILTSIEHDHIDIYPSLDQYLDAFRAFIAAVPPEGLIVAHAGDRRIVELLRAHARARVSYFALDFEDTGGEAVHWLGAPAETTPNGTTFDLYAGGVYSGRLVSPLFGHHNLKNVLAALAALAEGYQVRLESLRDGLPRFAGVKRRQELLGEPGGIYLYDDFAHHPTAVRETLRALRFRHPKGRIAALFEPRSATACRGLHQAEYAASFDDADLVVLAPLGRAIADESALDRRAVAARLSSLGKNVLVPDALDPILPYVAERTRPGDVVVVFSNGAFGGIHARLSEALTARSASSPQSP